MNNFLAAISTPNNKHYHDRLFNNSAYGDVNYKEVAYVDSIFKNTPTSEYKELSIDSILKELYCDCDFMYSDLDFDEIEKELSLDVAFY